MKILVCGGTRFYGKKLVNQLVESGHEVVVISRHIEEKNVNVRYICGELSKELVSLNLNDEFFDICVANILMDKQDAKNYLFCLKEKVKKHIIISSIGVYDSKYTSESAFNPYKDACTGSYQEKKHVEKIIVNSIVQRKVLILRPAIIIGEDDWTHRMEFYLQRIKDCGGIITQSQENNTISFVYDWQLARVVLYFINNGWKKAENTINVATNREYSYIELIKIMMECIKVRNTTLLKININEEKPPFDKFKDPYGKGNNSCDVSKLEAIDRNLVNYDEVELKKLINTLNDKYRIDEVPNYSFRDEEIAFIKNNSDRIVRVC